MDNKLLTPSIMALSLFISGNSFSYSAYNLHDDLWAVECKDGKLENYIGDESGIEEQGTQLCKDNGGLLDESTDLIVKAFDSESKNTSHETSIIVRGLEDDHFEEIPTDIQEPFDAKEMPTEELDLEERQHTTDSNL